MSIISSANEIEDCIKDILSHVEGYLWSINHQEEYPNGDIEDYKSEHIYQIKYYADRIRKLI